MLMLVLARVSAAVALAVVVAMLLAQAFKESFDSSDFARMRDIVLERHRHGARLQEFMVRHRNIPMGLGSGATSVVHKARAVCRAIVAETQSVPGALSAMQRVRAFCTDMGTEMSLADLSGFSAADIFPSWMLEDRVELDIDGGAPAALADDLAAHVFPHSVVSAGVIHICNNLAWDADQLLPGWSDFLPGLKVIAHLLHEQHLRQRLVQACVRPSRFADSAHPFDRPGIPKPATWRWGVAVSILRNILPLRRILKGVWNPAEFSGSSDSSVTHAGGNTDGDNGAHSDRLDVALLTRTIRSSKWWAYAFMVRLLNGFASEFSQWAEGCPCHYWLRPLDTCARAALATNQRFSDECLCFEQIRKD